VPEWELAGVLDWELQPALVVLLDMGVLTIPAQAPVPWHRKLLSTQGRLLIAR
jgi:hypothetical protein